MTDAPERIWVEDERPLGGGVYVWNARNDPSKESKQYAVEYIRADLVGAQRAEIDLLREALRPFSRMVDKSSCTITVQWSDANYVSTYTGVLVPDDFYRAWAAMSD